VIARKRDAPNCSIARIALPAAHHKGFVARQRFSWVTRRQHKDSGDNSDSKCAEHLTRHKISDRARERAWPQTGLTNYTKASHQSGAPGLRGRFHPFPSIHSV
jgi:hypothetical protein